MKHFEYVWDMGPGYIIPDEELNVERLEWKAGQFWQLLEEDGRLIFRQVDPIVQFLLEGKDKPNE